MLSREIMQRNLNTNYFLYNDFKQICMQKDIDNIEKIFKELILEDCNSFSNFINLYKNNTFKPFPLDQWFTITELYDKLFDEEFINILCNSRGHGIGSGEYLSIFFLKNAKKCSSNKDRKGDIINEDICIEVKGHKSRIGVDDMDVKPLYRKLISPFYFPNVTANELNRFGTLSINTNKKNNINKNWYMLNLYNNQSININTFKQLFEQGIIETHPYFTKKIYNIDFIDNMFYQKDKKIVLNNMDKGWLKFELKYYKINYNFDQMMLIKPNNSIYISLLENDEQIDKLLEQVEIIKYPLLTPNVGREDHRFMIGLV